MVNVLQAVVKDKHAHLNMKMNVYSMAVMSFALVLVEQTVANIIFSLISESSCEPSISTPLYSVRSFSIKPTLSCR